MTAKQLLALSIDTRQPDPKKPDVAAIAITAFAIGLACGLIIEMQIIGWLQAAQRAGDCL